MLKIGVTGGIGSGKSTVCRIFQVLGIPVFYADEVAKSVMHTDEILIQGVRKAFGEKSYSADRDLDRKYIAGIVFNNPGELEKLNALVHPAVFRAFDEWVIKQQSSYVVKEAALLFESGSDKMCDETVLVKSPYETRIQRIMKRDGLSEEEIRLRMKRQLSDEEKEKLAGHILLNNEQVLLIPQVLKLHAHFMMRTV